MSVHTCDAMVLVCMDFRFHGSAVLFKAFTLGLHLGCGLRAHRLLDHTVAPEQRRQRFPRSLA